MKNRLVGREIKYAPHYVGRLSTRQTPHTNVGVKPNNLYFTQMIFFLQDYEVIWQLRLTAPPYCRMLPAALFLDRSHVK